MYYVYIYISHADMMSCASLTSNNSASWQINTHVTLRDHMIHINDTLIKHSDLHMKQV